MDVSVLYKRAQRWLHGLVRPAILGNGMLERARATSLALLGFTAAVGLAIVALAANQGWPLIAGSSIPQIPPRHQAVGPAVVVAGVESPAAGVEGAAISRRVADGARGAAGQHGEGASPSTPAPATSTELVVSPSAPTEPRGGHSHGPPKPAPTPAPQPTRPASSAPAAVPAPAPPTQAPPAAEPSPPDATSSEAPAEESESHVPPWSHGHGHAHGRDGSSVEGDEWDDHSDDGDDHWYGHHDD